MKRLWLEYLSLDLCGSDGILVVIIAVVGILVEYLVGVLVVRFAVLGVFVESLLVVRVAVVEYL